MANKHCVVIREMPSQNAVDYRFGVYGTDIDNGHVVGLKEMKDHDLWIAEASTDAANLWLVTGVELMYEENPRKHLYDYTNESGKPFRCERVLAGGTYAISAEGLTVANASTDLVAGAAVMFVSGSDKLTVAKTADGTVIGKVIEVYTKSGMTFAAIEFFKAAVTAEADETTEST